MPDAPRPIARSVPTLACLALVVGAFASPAGAAMYKCRAADGGLEFRDRPCAEGAELVARAATATRLVRAGSPGTVGTDSGPANAPVAPAPAPSSAAALPAAPEPLLGTWRESGASETVTVRAGGAFGVRDGQMRAEGRWRARGDTPRGGGAVYDMTLDVDGRSVRCEAAIAGVELILSCPGGQVSFYDRV